MPITFLSQKSQARVQGRALWAHCLRQRPREVTASVGKEARIVNRFQRALQLTFTRRGHKSDQSVFAQLLDWRDVSHSALILANSVTLALTIERQCRLSETRNAKDPYKEGPRREHGPAKRACRDSLIRRALGRPA